MAEKVFVPPLKIQGIKTKLVPLIRQNVMMAENSVWVEPFMGSGVVGFNIEPSFAVFADSNPHIIEFYNQIKSNVVTPYVVRGYLEREGKLLEQGGAEYYYAVRKRFNKEHKPLDFLFLNRACFNGMIRFNKDCEFNVPYGHKPQRFSKAYITKIVNQVAWASDLIHKHSWDFVCQSFEETIRMAGTADFIYCDPPYIGRHVDYYDSWNDDCEQALHDVLIRSGARFMLSTWDHNDYRANEYITSIWLGCEKITRNHFYHIGATEAHRRPIVEALLTNYKTARSKNRLPLPGEQLSLFDENIAV